jgi:hypothetical protein
MSPQACLIFTKVPPSDLRGGFRLNVPGSVLVNFDSLEGRQEYCDSPLVWWYAFVEEMDSVFGEGSGAIGQGYGSRGGRPRQQNIGVSAPRPWKKGGAWEAEETALDLERKQEMTEDREDMW